MRGPGGLAAAIVVLAAAFASLAQQPPSLGMGESDDIKGGLSEAVPPLEEVVPPGAPILQIVDTTYALLVATVTGRVQGPLLGVSFAPQLSSPSSLCVVLLDTFTCVVTRNVLDSKTQALTITAAGPRGSSQIAVGLTFP